MLNSLAHALGKKIGDQAADEAVGGKQDILRMIEEAIANKPVGHLSKYV